MSKTSEDTTKEELKEINMYGDNIKNEDMGRFTLMLFLAERLITVDRYNEYKKIFIELKNEEIQKRIRGVQ